MIGESWIEYNGEKYRLAFTMLQLEHMTHLVEENKDAIEGRFGGIISIACLLFSAYAMACKQDRVKPNLSFEDFQTISDYLFTNDSEQYAQVNADFEASNAYKKTFGSLDDEEKKRLTLIASEVLPPANSA